MSESNSAVDDILTRFSNSVAAAFEPLLDPIAIRNQLDQPLYDFLDPEYLFVRQRVFEQLNIPNALWAIRCWTTLAEEDHQPKATVLPISDVNFVKYPSYTDIEIAPGRTEPCLSAGRILLERSGRRCVIEVRAFRWAEPSPVDAMSDKAALCQIGPRLRLSASVQWDGRQEFARAPVHVGGLDGELCDGKRIAITSGNSQ